MLQTLEKQGTAYTLFSEVEPDPTFAIVEKGLSLYRQDNCGGVIAVGGGSSIDAAKVIALAVTNEVEPRSLVGIIKGRKAAAPFFVIPTTAGTGSEATIGAVISDNETHNKELVIDHKLVPLMCALDPALMTGLPAPITAATGIDALTHLIEGYLSGLANDTADFYARSGIQLVFENLPVACRRGTSVKARENMSLASYYGGLVVNSAGLGYTHAFAHQLGRLYKLPHGIANAKVLPLVLEYNRFAAVERLAELARVLKLEEAGDDELSLADKFIEAVRNLIREIGISPCVEELKKSDYSSIIRLAFKEANSTYAVAKYMSYDEAEELLDALGGNCRNHI
jgi:alcohol dehydrogenase